jgi:hypothetical protein
LNVNVLPFIMGMPSILYPESLSFIVNNFYSTSFIFSSKLFISFARNSMLSSQFLNALNYRSINSLTSIIPF